MWGLSGHIGSSVSALVDGQLDPESAEKAWSHVLSCAACRRLVQREGWVKCRLSSMAGTEPSARLLGSLYSLESPGAQERLESLQAWAAVDELERKGRGRRRAGLVLAGAGSVSAAVFGFASLGGAGLGIGGAPSAPPPANLSPATSTPTTASAGSSGSVRGTIPPTSPRGSRMGAVLPR